MDEGVRKPQNPSRRHHYIPAFYLKRWTGSDGKICQMSRFDGVVKPVRRAPTATGHEDGLYELKGFDPKEAQLVEEQFFKPIDTAADQALTLLERYGHRAPWTSRTRSAWSQFLISLLMRCPEDVAAFREYWPQHFAQTDEPSEARYQKSRSPTDPETFHEYILSQPQKYMEGRTLEQFMGTINHSRIGGFLNNMQWRVAEMPDHAPSLLTSDRPIFRTNGLDKSAGYIALPIGPQLLFIGSKDVEWLEAVGAKSRVELAKEINRTVVGAAVRFVWGANDVQLPFVQKRMGGTPQHRLMDSLMARSFERALPASSASPEKALSVASKAQQAD